MYTLMQFYFFKVLKLCLLTTKTGAPKRAAQYYQRREFGLKGYNWEFNFSSNLTIIFHDSSISCLVYKCHKLIKTLITLLVLRVQRNVLNMLLLFSQKTKHSASFLSHITNKSSKSQHLKSLCQQMFEIFAWNISIIKIASNYFFNRNWLSAAALLASYFSKFRRCRKKNVLSNGS